MQKGVKTCGYCDMFEGCKTVGAIVSGNEEALNNLKKTDI